MRSYSSLTVTWPGGIGDPNGPDGQTIPVGGRRKRSTRRNRKGRKGSRKQQKQRKHRTHRHRRNSH